MEGEGEEEELLPLDCFWIFCATLFTYAFSNVSWLRKCWPRCLYTSSKSLSWQMPTAYVIPKQLPTKELTTGLLNCSAERVTGAVNIAWSMASRLTIQ
jgi:hypothetical protein